MIQAFRFPGSFGKALMLRVVEIETPLRLHFGLFSFRGTGRQFGGVGAMAGLAGPRVRISAAKRFVTTGVLKERVADFARRWAEWHGWNEVPACHLDTPSVPPEHSGLGVGTQLALAVATGLNTFFDRPAPSPAELALSVGRGLRSAVGTYGFAMGGLVVEQGKLPNEPISPLDFQIDLPETWRFALVRPRAGSGLAGSLEQEAFAELPPVPAETTEMLVTEVRERMAPAAAQAAFGDFSESVYEFGRVAGECFAARQGGPYNGPLLTELVAAIRASGIRGVGQSSWGPTIFALLPSESGFAGLTAELAGRFPDADLEFQCHPPNNSGAKIVSNLNAGISNPKSQI
jgi:beta-ribofuranosylaminobenzene 5'-phosphate synthase